MNNGKSSVKQKEAKQSAKTSCDESEESCSCFPKEKIRFDGKNDPEFKDVIYKNVKDLCYCPEYIKNEKLPNDSLKFKAANYHNIRNSNFGPKYKENERPPKDSLEFKDVNYYNIGDPCSCPECLENQEPPQKGFRRISNGYHEGPVPDPYFSPDEFQLEDRGTFMLNTQQTRDYTESSPSNDCFCISEFGPQGKFADEQHFFDEPSYDLAQNYPNQQIGISSNDYSFVSSLETIIETSRERLLYPQEANYPHEEPLHTVAYQNAEFFYPFPDFGLKSPVSVTPILQRSLEGLQNLQFEPSKEISLKGYNYGSEFLVRPPENDIVDTPQLINGGFDYGGKYSECPPECFKIESQEVSDSPRVIYENISFNPIGNRSINSFTSNTSSSIEVSPADLSLDAYNTLKRFPILQKSFPLRRDLQEVDEDRFLYAYEQDNISSPLVFNEEIFEPERSTSPDLPIPHRYVQTADIYDKEEIITPYIDGDIFLPNDAIVDNHLRNEPFAPEDLSFVDELRAPFESHNISTQRDWGRFQESSEPLPEYLLKFPMHEIRFEITDETLQSKLNQIGNLFPYEEDSGRPIQEDLLPYYGTPQKFTAPRQIERPRRPPDTPHYNVYQTPSKIPILQKRKDKIMQLPKKPKTNYRIEVTTNHLKPIQSTDKPFKPLQQVDTFLKSKWPKGKLLVPTLPQETPTSETSSIFPHEMQTDKLLASKSPQEIPSALTAIEGVGKEKISHIGLEKMHKPIPKKSLEQWAEANLKDLEDHGISIQDAMESSSPPSKIIWMDKIPTQVIPGSAQDESNLGDDCTGKEICACDMSNIVHKALAYYPWAVAAAIIPEKQWLTAPYGRRHPNQIYTVKIKEIPELIPVLFTLTEAPEPDEEITSSQVATTKSLIEHRKQKGIKFKSYVYKKWDSFYRYHYGKLGREIEKPKELKRQKLKHKDEEAKKELPTSVVKLQLPKADQVDSSHRYNKEELELHTVVPTSTHQFVKTKGIPEIIPEIYTMTDAPKPYGKLSSYHIAKTRSLELIESPASKEENKFKPRDIKNWDSFYLYDHKELQLVREKMREDTLKKELPKDKQDISVEPLYERATITKLTKERPSTASKIQGPRDILTYKYKSKDKLDMTPKELIFETATKSKPRKEKSRSLPIIEPPDFERCDSFYKYENKESEKVTDSRKHIQYQRGTLTRLFPEEPQLSSKIEPPRIIKVESEADIDFVNLKLATVIRTTLSIHEPINIVDFTEDVARKIYSSYCLEELGKEIKETQPIYQRATITKSKLIFEMPQKFKLDVSRVDSFYRYEKKSGDIVLDTLKYDRVKISKLSPQVPESYTKLVSQKLHRIHRAFKFYSKKQNSKELETVPELPKTKLPKEKPKTATKMKEPKSGEVDFGKREKKQPDDELKTKPIYNLASKSITPLDKSGPLDKMKEVPFDRVDSFYRYEPPKKDKLPKEAVSELTKTKLPKAKPTTATKIKEPKSGEVDFGKRDEKQPDDELKTKPIYNLASKSITPLDKSEPLDKMKEVPFERVDSFYRYEPPKKDKFPKEAVSELTKSKLPKAKPTTATKIKEPKSGEVDFGKREENQPDDELKTKPIYNLASKSITPLDKSEPLDRMKEVPFDRVDSFYRYEPPKKDKFPKEAVSELTKSKLPKAKPTTATKIKEPKSGEVDFGKREEKQPDDELKTKPIYNLASKSITPLDKSEPLDKMKEVPFDRVDSFYRYEPPKKEKFPKEAVSELTKTKLPKAKPTTATKIKEPKSGEVDFGKREKKQPDDELKTKPIYNLASKSITPLNKLEPLDKSKELPFDRVDSFYRYEPPKKDKLPKEAVSKKREKKEPDDELKTKPIYNLASKSITPINKSEPLDKSKELPFDRVDSFYRYEPPKKDKLPKEAVSKKREKKEHDDELKTKPIYNLASKSITPINKSEPLDKSKEIPFDRVDSFYRYEPPKKDKLPKEAVSKKREKKEPDDELETKPIYNLASKSITPINKSEPLDKSKELPFDRVDSFYRYEPPKKDKLPKEAVSKKREKKESDDELKTKPIYNLASKSITPINKSEPLDKSKELPFDRVDSFYKYEPPKKDKLPKEAVSKKREKKEPDDELKTKPIYNLASKSITPLNKSEPLDKSKELPFDRVDSFYKYEPPKKDKLPKEAVSKKREKKEPDDELKTKPIYNLASKSITPINKSEPLDKSKELPFDRVDSFYRYEPPKKDTLPKEAVSKKREKKEPDDELKTKPIYNLASKSITPLNKSEPLDKSKELPFDRVDSFYRYEPPKKDKLPKEAVSKKREKKEPDDELKTKPIYNLASKSITPLNKSEPLDKSKELPFDRVDSFYKYEPPKKDKLPKEAVSKKREKKEPDDELKIKPIYNLASKSITPINKSEPLDKSKELPFDRVDSFYRYEPPKKDTLPKEAVSKKREKKEPDDELKIKPIYNLASKSITPINKSEPLDKSKELPFDRVDSFYKYEPPKKDKLPKEAVSKKREKKEPDDELKTKPIYNLASKSITPINKSEPLDKSKELPFDRVDSFYKYEPPKKDKLPKEAVSKKREKKEPDDELKTKPIYNLASKSITPLNKSEPLDKSKELPFDRVDSFYRYEPPKKDKLPKEAVSKKREKKEPDDELKTKPIYNLASKSITPLNKSEPLDKSKELPFDRVDSFYRYEPPKKDKLPKEAVSKKREKKEPDDELKTKPIYNLASKSITPLNKSEPLDKSKELPFDRVDSFYKYEPPKKDKLPKEAVSKKREKKEPDDELKIKPIYNLASKSITPINKSEPLDKSKELPFDRVDSFYKYEPPKKDKLPKEAVSKKREKKEPDDELKTKPIYNLASKSITPLNKSEPLDKSKELPFDRVDSFYRYEPPKKDKLPKEAVSKKREKKEPDDELKTKPIYNLASKSITPLNKSEPLDKSKELPFDRVDSFYRYEPPKKDKLPKEAVSKKREKKEPDDDLKTKPIYNLASKSITPINKSEPLDKSKELPFDRVDSFYKYEPPKKDKLPKEAVSKKREKKEPDDELKTKPIYNLASKSITPLNKSEPLDKSKELPFDRVDSFYRYEPPKKDKLPKEAVSKKREKKEPDDELKTKPIYNLASKSITPLNKSEPLDKSKELPFARVDSFYRYEPPKKDKLPKEAVSKKREKMEHDNELKTKPIYNLASKSITPLNKSEPLDKSKKLPFDRVDSFYRYEPPKKDKLPKEAVSKKREKKEPDDELKTKPIYNLASKSITPINKSEPLDKSKELPFDRVDSFYKYEPPKKDKLPKEAVSKKREKKEPDDELKTKPIYNLASKSITPINKSEPLDKSKELPFDRVDSFYKYEPPKKDKLPKEAVSKKREKKEPDDELKTKPIYNLASKSITPINKSEPLDKSKELPFDRVDSFYKYEPPKKDKLPKEAVSKKREKKEPDDELKTKPIYNLASKSITPINKSEPLDKSKELPFDRVDSFYKYEPPKKDKLPKEAVSKKREKKEPDDELKTKPIYNLASKSITPINKSEPLDKSKELPFDRVDSFYKYEPPKKDKLPKEAVSKKREKKEPDDELKTKPIYNLASKSITPINKSEPLDKSKELPFDRVDSFYKYEPPKKDKLPKEAVSKKREKKEPDDELKTKPIYNLASKSITPINKSEPLDKSKELPFDRVDSFYKYEPPKKDKLPKEAVSKKREKKEPDDELKTKPIYNLASKSITPLNKSEPLDKSKELPFDRVDSFYRYELPKKDKLPKEAVSKKREKKEPDDKLKTKPIYNLASKSITPLNKSKPLDKSKELPFDRVDSFYRYEPPKKDKLPKEGESYDVDLAYIGKKEADNKLKTKPIFDLVRKSKTPLLEPDKLDKMKEPNFNRVDSFYRYEKKDIEKLLSKKPVYEKATKIRMPKKKSLSSHRIKQPKSHEVEMSYKYKKEERDKTESTYVFAKISKFPLNTPESMTILKEPPFRRVDSFYRYEKKESGKALAKSFYEFATKTTLPKNAPLSSSKIKPAKSNMVDLSYKYKKEDGDKVKLKQIYDLATKIKVPIENPESIIRMKGPRFDRVDSFYRFERRVSDKLEILSTYETAIKLKLPKEKPLSTFEMKGPKADEIDLSYKYEKEIKVITYEKMNKPKRPDYELSMKSKLPIDQAESYDKIHDKAKKVDSFYKYEAPKMSSQKMSSTKEQPKTAKLTKLEKAAHIIKTRQHEHLWVDSDYIFKRDGVLKPTDQTALHWRILHKQTDEQKPQYGVEFDDQDNLWINYVIEYERMTYDDEHIDAILGAPNALLPFFYNTESSTMVIDVYTQTMTK